MQAVGLFLAAEARQNNHAFPNSTAEAASLIFNYSPISPNHDSYQVYYFP